MSKAHFGMIGLGTMGRNFLLNIAEHGIRGVGFDLDASKRTLLMDEGRGMPVDVGNDQAEFLSKLATPRNIMLLVPAGPVVDAVIAGLAPHLDEDDLVIDGGNSHYTDTERRETELSEQGIGFMGVGVSGGEEGARHGASIMPGGRREHYQRVETTLQAVAAKVNGEPCVAYMGKGSAGHFVKMVHNGIEYGMMQIISEAYDYMKRSLGMETVDIANTFAAWNEAELNSFLIEITAIALRKIDTETSGPLIDVILDTAGQKGTGKWTSQAAMDLGVPVPTIDAAVSMRQISARKSLRQAVSVDLGSEAYAPGIVAQANRHVTIDRHTVDVEDIKRSIYCAFVITYAQGLSLLQAASVEKGYDLDVGEIAKIWRGGCIIRSAMLENIRAAFRANPTLPSLLLDHSFVEILRQNTPSLRRTVSSFISSGVPGMCHASALSYFDALRTERLPANLIQAQRDLFGAHTYQRIDREGTFHTPDWND